MFDIQNKLNKNHFHFIFLFILSLNYLVPYILFGKITLFYHDALDSEIVYNQIIGKYLSGDSTAINLFLNGEVQFDYLRRIYQPIIFLYAVFETEFAYWLTDIVVKLTSYISFFILSKKLNNNYFACGLAACLFASLNVPTHNGLGVAIFPYLIYLTLFKEKITVKHLLITIFFGLNADLIFTLFAIPFLFISLIILGKNKLEKLITKCIKIFGVFIFAIIAANLNLILLGFSELIIHREEFFKDSILYSEVLTTFISSLFNFQSEINFSFFVNFPFLILLPFLFIFVFISREREAKNIFFLILLIEAILIFLQTELFINYYNDAKGLVRTLNIGYSYTILPLLYCIISILVLKGNRKKLNIIQIIIFSSILMSQINSSITPFYKKFILKENSYRNIYTFEEYYLHEDYKKLKKIIKDDRVMSIGVDPMVAIVNNIGTIDGYHNIYPLNYKKKFRKIIENEINININLKKYYDNWGSRVYAYINNPKLILINFSEAKNLGAKYVISNYNINNTNLKLVCDNCSKFLKLYLID